MNLLLHDLLLHGSDFFHKRTQINCVKTSYPIYTEILNMIISTHWGFWYNYIGNAEIFCYSPPASVATLLCLTQNIATVASFSTQNVVTLFKKQNKFPLRKPQRPQPVFDPIRVCVHFTFCCHECTHFA